MSQSAEEQGEEAYKNGLTMIDNPFSKYSDEWHQWADGWKNTWFLKLQAALRGKGEGE